MAKNTAKANARSNAQRLQQFWLITLACNLVHIATIWLWAGFPPSLWQLCGVGFWASQQVTAMKMLSSRGAPSYDAEGRIDDCADLSDPNQLGFATYAQDILWLCWALQVLSNAVSGYFSVLYVIVPVYAIYNAWTKLIGPMLAQRAQMQQMAAAGGAGAAGAGGAQAPPGAVPQAPGQPQTREQRRKAERDAKKQARKSWAEALR
eukprot:CAMPEP_0174856104 /NCGR_PEP_ID=MMETSP1114-20130205/35086_1 /TAXON_ID=312471 /ORGANISM="Neobodo designis, Strain CCAP 1951/1" /LENGTH=205 /DNA_ID=CAMNT_0016090881 /DNA_START=41 /DNA_END=655 /DNA_ORIENTATION=+